MHGPRNEMNLLSLSAEFFRLRDPALDAAGQSNLFADLVRRLWAKRGDLPVMEDSKIVVELLLDCGRHVCELLEIVSDAARPGQHLIAGTFRRRRQLLGDRFGGGADVDTVFALCA